MKGKRNSTLVNITAVIITCVVCVFCFTACNNSSPYSKDNSFDVEISDTDTALVFSPKNFEYSYGVIFYVGTLVSPQHYSYLGEALAKQGYLTVIPKFSGNMSYTNYLEMEPAFTDYPDVKFFVAGHDQGGGSAIRRAQENPQKVAGVILYSPLCFSRQVFDDNNKPVVDEDGNWVKTVDSIASLSLPTLLIESSDAVRTEEIKAEVLSRLNPSTVVQYTIADSYSTDFSTVHTDNESTEEQKMAQRNTTLTHTLAFLKNTVCGK